MSPKSPYGQNNPYGGRSRIRKAEVRLGRVPERKAQADDAPVRYEVHGKRASSYEYYVSVALDKFGLDYLFQVDYWGGRRLAGGMVLDFLVFTEPVPTPIFVQGAYFHQGERRSVDSFQAAQLQHLFHGQVRPALFWYNPDVSSIEAAERAVKRDIL
jgi:hypothetical protein